jgi:hypothetical protein
MKRKPKESFEQLIASLRGTNSLQIIKTVGEDGETTYHSIDTDDEDSMALVSSLKEKAKEEKEEERARPLPL